MTPLTPGALITLPIEKPAAGGRMIGRADGQVVLVAGAIPGEQVRARIERVGKGVAYAETVSVEIASTDRRDPFTDPLCGGCLYAHIAYARQLDIKAQVIADAFGRIGRMALPAAVAVAASPAEGYRMRARLHVRDGRTGFFREGTYDICDARATRQLLPATSDTLARVSAALQAEGVSGVREIEVAENVDGSARVVHLDCLSPVDASRAQAAGHVDGLTGLTMGDRQSGRPVVVTGDPRVTDVLRIGEHAVTLRRHVLAFFQGNRYLLRDLVARVVGHVPAESQVVDLYAGTGLFAVSAANARSARVTAVEADPIAARDLETNAEPTEGRVKAVRQSVEAFTGSGRHRPDVVIVDPPRTGMSRKALDGAIGLGARTAVYVSCDVATLARDARRLLDAGYAIRQVDAFDLFPNTPHVETVVLFERPA